MVADYFSRLTRGTRARTRFAAARNMSENESIDIERITSN